MAGISFDGCTFQIIDHLVILFATAPGNIAGSALSWAILDAKSKFSKINYLKKRSDSYNMTAEKGAMDFLLSQSYFIHFDLPRLLQKKEFCCGIFGDGNII